MPSEDEPTAFIPSLLHDDGNVAAAATAAAVRPTPPPPLASGVGAGMGEETRQPAALTHMILGRPLICTKV